MGNVDPTVGAVKPEFVISSIYERKRQEIEAAIKLKDFQIGTSVSN